jgi:hypothetical protein
VAAGALLAGATYSLAAPWLHDRGHGHEGERAAYLSVFR